MKNFQINNLPQKINVDGRFDETCKMEISSKSLKAIREGRLKIQIRQHGKEKNISNCFISLSSLSGNISIYFSSDNSRVIFEEGSRGRYDLRLWRESRVKIGRDTTSNGIKIVCKDSEFLCGKDCMFSDGILIQSADQHGIVDLSTGLIVNGDRTTVSLGDHVWLGRQSTLTSKANVGSGSVIGMGSIVTKSLEGNVLAAGIPAKVIKENHTWSRFSMKLDDYSASIVDGDCYPDSQRSADL